jgi:hypothetical protein
MFNDLMENIEWFLNLHDNKDGYLTKDEVLTLSESLLVRKLFCFLPASQPITTRIVIRWAIRLALCPTQQQLTPALLV